MDDFYDMMDQDPAIGEFTEVEKEFPYIDKKGDLVLPLSWKDNDADVDEKTYKKMLEIEK